MSSISLTDEQFKELREALGSYVKVVALAGINEISKAHLARNVWLLRSAGFSQPQIENILDVDQSTVSRILAGKTSKKKDKKTTEE